MRRRRAAALALLGLLVPLCQLAGAGPASATPSTVLGSGSTYVNLAMNQWKSQANSAGLPVQYTPNGSPAGMSLYASGQSTAFAGTEAEFSSLQIADRDVPRGFQYVPDVAGATAIMYNLREKSGAKVDYLHLDPVTIARIFIGTITRWSDPAISATNKGIVFPDEPIKVVLRGSKSGTTALFYDFVAKTLGAEYVSWFEGNGCGSAAIRPVLIECRSSTALPNRPTTLSFSDSQQIAQFVANDRNGAFSIAFDEFSYAKSEKVPTAWVRNGAGAYVLPYAENISAALEAATLRPDLSQELSGVYRSANPKAYPVSAYSYITLPCLPSADRVTCKGPYTDPGQTETMSRFLSYIACDGQTAMATLGYSPLPPNLSQEMENAVARLTGAAVKTLTPGTCSNPRFRGSLGAGATSPCDPFLCGGSAGGSSGGSGAGGGAGAPAAGATRAPTAGGAGPAAAGGAGAAPGAAAGGAVTDPAAAGLTGSGTTAVGGGSGADAWRKAAPVAFDAAQPAAGPGSLPLLLLLAAVVAPWLVRTVSRGLRSRREVRRSRPAG